MSNLIFWALTIFRFVGSTFSMFDYAVICMPVVLDFLSNFLVLPIFSYMFLDCSFISFLAFCFTTVGLTSIFTCCGFRFIGVLSLHMFWFNPCLCRLSAAFACSSGSLLALDVRLGPGGAPFSSPAILSLLGDSCTFC